MLKPFCAFRRARSVEIVSDQRGCPTSAKEIAKTVLHIVSKVKKDQFGIYHFCQPQATNWFEFACEIVSQAQKLGFPISCNEVLPIKTEEYPLPAKRPKNSVLNCEKIIKEFQLELIDWKESLHEVLKELKSE